MKATFEAIYMSEVGLMFHKGEPLFVSPHSYFMNTYSVWANQDGTGWVANVPAGAIQIVKGETGKPTNWCIFEEAQCPFAEYRNKVFNCTAPSDDEMPCHNK